MRHYRFFLRSSDTFPFFQHKESFRLGDDLEPEIVFQMVKVLRIKPGDTVTLTPQTQKGQQEQKGPGAPAPFHEYVFEVTGVTKNSVELAKKNVVVNENELKFPLELWLCLPNKPEKLEFIVQKGVEIGVTVIRLFESDFSQMKHQLRLERLQKILIEAAEQSERAVVPMMKMEGPLDKFLKSADDTMLKNVFVAMERSGNSHSGNPFEHIQKDQGISVLVGPEGGFSDAEKDVITGRSLHIFSLGKRVLRMETAAIISLGLAAL